MPHGMGVDGAVDMTNDPELVDRAIEEGTPHVEVVLDEVYDDRNVNMNVHMLDQRSSDRSRVGGRISKGAGGVDRNENRRGWARRHEEERNRRI
jgi:hypothetical protein